MYSQNQEEIHILDYFGDHVGRLIDIGANNGENLSNSRALIERGWSGVLIEPSPGAFKSLESLYFENPNVRCLQAAIGKESGFTTLYDCKDSLISTISPEHRDLFPAKYDEVKVPVWTFRDLLLFNPGPYDFITIDAEGLDWDILRQIDLTEVKMVCAEHGGTHFDEIFRYCTDYGMKLIYSCFENIIMAK